MVIFHSYVKLPEGKLHHSPLWLASLARAQSRQPALRRGVLSGVEETKRNWQFPGRVQRVTGVSPFSMKHEQHETHIPILGKRLQKAKWNITIYNR